MEQWKKIDGYDGSYLISSLGNVFHVGRGALRLSTDSGGYHYVRLRRGGISKFPKVHRLVAEAFIPNPNKYPCINHKDENKKNNAVSNLEWCTPKYNTNYGTCIKRRALNCRKHVVQFSLDGEQIREWDGIVSASQELHIDGSSITKAAKGKRMSAGGFIWEYAQNDKG